MVSYLALFLVTKVNRTLEQSEKAEIKFFYTENFMLCCFCSNMTSRTASAVLLINNK